MCVSVEYIITGTRKVAQGIFDASIPHIEEVRDLESFAPPSICAQNFVI